MMFLELGTLWCDDSFMRDSFRLSDTFIPFNSFHLIDTLPNFDFTPSTYWQ